ncbi:MAG TPA: DUF4126 domain-containing protein [Pyrinomonadaceae bacterium]|jgi:hypothetical protein
MDLIQVLGTALGAAWTSGINLYATVAALGLLQHFHLVGRLPGGLDALDNPWIIGVACALYLVEFVADKVPYVDSVWDVVHTFIRVPAGAALALAATTELHPTVRVLAVLLGGTLALSAHGTKATLRAAANTSPEPLTNWLLSLGEDVLAVGAVVLAVLYPLALLFVLAAFVLLLVWLLPKVLRGLRRLFAGARQLLAGRPVSRQHT